MGKAYMFDAVRTPRGRGRGSGSLHEVSPLRLAAGVLKNIRDRNDLDTNKVDDVILGVADPVNEQGADIARTAVLVAGYDQGTPGVQINRFCASGLEACRLRGSVALDDGLLQGTSGVRAVDSVVSEYAVQARRTQNGNPDRPGIVDRCIGLSLDGTLDVETAAMAKYWTTDLQCKLVDECLQFHGGYGYMRDYAIGRAFVDARAQRIYSGTNEIMKEIISRTN
jgi:hypothetical protein